MKSWIVRGVVGFGTGLGKRDVLVFPQENGRVLLVSLVTDGRVWIEDTDERVPPKSDDYLIDEVEIPVELVEEITSSFAGSDISQETKDRIFEFAQRH